MKSLKRGLTLLLLVALLIPATGYARENTTSGITRVEFAAWINQVFRYINEGEWSFRDQDVNESSLSELRKAVAAGYIQGYGDGTLRPYQTVSRQEAAVMLVKAFRLSSESDFVIPESIKDSNEWPAWSSSAISALFEQGYVSGYPDQTFRPKQPISRNEAFNLIGHIAGEMIDKPGTYSGISSRNAVINQAEVVLEDSVIAGNLYLSEGIAEGAATLNRVTVSGTVFVSGSQTLHLSGSKLHRLVMERKADLVLDSDSSVEILDILVNEEIHVKGNGYIGSEDSRIVREEETAKSDDSKGAVSLGITPTAPSQGGNSNNPANPEPGAEPPLFTNVSVHDPSVIKDASAYYVFGSHIDAAKSADLQNWTKFTNGYTTPGNVIYGDLSENLADSFKWAGEDDADSKGGYAVWAPDVIWNENYKNPDGTTGAFMQYYSASSTYIRSAIGFAVSQNIEGPYLYGDTVVYSGFTLNDAKDADSSVNKKWTQTHLPELIETGQLNSENPGWFKNTGEYNNAIYPNAIDASLFFDKEEKLWMAYGSWSGGIFLLELDPETGLPKYPGQDGVTEDGRLIDRYFGVKIAGGFTKSGEGPYIFYDPSTDCYYLNVTYGWLGADGGYNMRQFRASSPAGPYLDASGQNAVLTDQNTANDLVGIKMMGNFLFKKEIGETSLEDGYGYVSPGHNSVFYDEAAGKYFLLFHTRFPERGEAHELRVHQMFMNKDGWLVTAPERYSGETAAAVKEDDISGDYKFVNHGLSYSGAVTESLSITLEKDKKITGGVEGSWNLEGGYDAEIVVNGEAYNGVFVQGWDPLLQQNTLTFTAISAKGEAIWGIKQPDMTDQQAVRAVEQALTLGDTSRLTDNLQLPERGVRGTKIEWLSSDPSVISDSGVISPPDPGEEPLVAELTATITKGAFSAAKKFQVRVIPLDLNEGLVAHYAFEDDLSDLTENYKDGKVTGPLIDEQNGNLTFSKGVTGNAVVFDGGSGIRLPDGLISGNEYSVSLWVYPEEHSQFSTTFFGARSKSSWVSLVPDSWDNNTMLWSGEAWYDGSTGSRIRTKEWHHLVFTVNEGSVKVFVNGEQQYTGKGFPDIFKDESAVFSLGVNWWDRPFEGKMDELRIYNTSLTDALVKRLSQESSFDEEEGKAELAAKFLFEHDLADHSGNFGSGEIIGSQLASLDAGNLDFAEGVNGSAVVLDGKSGILLPKGLVATPSYSVTMWVYADELTPYTPVFFGAQSNTNWVSLQPMGHDGAGNSAMLWSGSKWYDAGTGIRIAPQEWVHLAFTVNRGNVVVYVNGEVRFTGLNFPDVFTDDQGTFSLGVNWWDPPFKGRIDEVCLFKGALTDEEVKELASP